MVRNDVPPVTLGSSQSTAIETGSGTDMDRPLARTSVRWSMVYETTGECLTRTTAPLSTSL
jgi:hypothetical protein